MVVDAEHMPPPIAPVWSLLPPVMTPTVSAGEPLTRKAISTPPVVKFDAPAAK